MEEEEGEEVQGVQGLLSPGGKVSETPTAVKEMEGGCCFQRCLQCEELKEQVGVQRLIVIRPVDGQVPTNGNVCIDKVVQPVVDHVQGCDCKVRANAVDAAVQPINHPPHKVLLFSLTMYSSLLSNLTM